MRKDVSIAIVAIFLVAAATVTATPNGQPFQEIWDAINALQQQVGSVAWTNITGIPADIADGDDIGTLSVNERNQTFTCPTAHSCAQFVRCQSGEVLTGGGFVVNDPTGPGILDIWTSRPHPTVSNSWLVEVKNNDPVSLNFIVYAMCAKIS